MSRCRHGISTYGRITCSACIAERQVEELQSELAHEREKQDREREERLRESRESARQAMHTADSWEEAFPKGITLAQAEARGEAEDIQKYGEPATGEPYFTHLVKTWSAAQAIYTEEMAKARPEILERIAKQVETKLAGQTGAVELVEALREDNHLHLVDW